MSIFCKWVEADGRFAFSVSDNGGIEISNAEHATLIEQNAQGLHIVPDQDGRPIAVRATVTAEQVWESIKAERDRRRFTGGVKVSDHWFLSTTVATGEYAVLSQIGANLPADTVLRSAWRTMDGAEVDMTPALVSQILTAGFATIAAIDDAAKAHKAALAASADPSAYDFSTGWPAIYGE